MYNRKYTVRNENAKQKILAWSKTIFYYIYDITFENADTIFAQNSYSKLRKAECKRQYFRNSEIDYYMIYDIN